MTEKNYFQQLNSINVSENLEEKQGFSYLSWAFAQEILGEKHPEAEIVVRDYGPDELPYLKTELGYFVQVYITIDGIKKGKPFPVMDGANRPLGAEYWKKDTNHKDKGYYVMNRQPTSFDINNSIQRAFVKAAAEHGLGLYVYRGEDLPTSVVNDRKAEIMSEFIEWRKNPKTNNYFITKEALLGPMKDWEMSAMEGIHKELTLLKAKAEEKAKAQAELERRGDTKPAEEKKPLKDQGMDLEKQKYIMDSCAQYTLVDDVVGEYMTKHKKDTLTQLTGKQFETLYTIVQRKVETAEKESNQVAST